MRAIERLVLFQHDLCFIPCHNRKWWDFVFGICISYLSQVYKNILASAEKCSDIQCRIVAVFVVGDGFFFFSYLPRNDVTHSIMVSQTTSKPLSVDTSWQQSHGSCVHDTISATFERCKLATMLNSRRSAWMTLLTNPTVCGPTFSSSLLTNLVPTWHWVLFTVRHAKMEEKHHWFSVNDDYS